jgi:hypothetical protein
MPTGLFNCRDTLSVSFKEFDMIAFFGLFIFTSCFVYSADAKEFFVSPDGNSESDGSKEKPLDLKTALSEKSPAQPGDTIWLLGGVYKGGFTSALKGKARFSHNCSPISRSARYNRLLF